ncbi:MAG TPA: hypothetical protein VNA04_07065 [Thermoanaerobaculia bacterium]|nr:hypothetical protein [Thermoanaerobaculia bacterium]
MIVERHYDDETLIGLLSRTLDPERDSHLAICSTCSDTLASYKVIAEVLGEEAAWDLRDLRQEPVPETVAALRSASLAVAADQHIATAAVANLLRLPQQQWLPAVTASSELQKPAIVHALVKASEEVLYRDPAEALTVARLATEVGGVLVPQHGSADVVFRSRGTAWRQFAFVAFYVGDYPAAWRGVDQAQTAFESCVVSDYELGRVSIVRGLILSASDRHEEALDEARSAARIFRAFGDRQRFAAARSAEAFSLLNQLRYREALPILEDLEERYKADMDSEARALVLGNLALCQWQLGAVPRALDLYQITAAIYEETANAPEAARVRYNVACLLAAEGRHAEAKLRLRSVRDDFQRLGMAHMAVSAGLDLAELLLAEKSYADAEELCATAVQQFQTTGLSTTTEGMTALLYLREATAQRRATPQTAQHVRKYIQRLPKEPQLLFAPPPSPPI